MKQSQNKHPIFVVTNKFLIILQAIGAGFDRLNRRLFPLASKQNLLAGRKTSWK